MKAGLIALCLLLAQASFAQTVVRAAFDVDRVPVNQPATATIAFDRTDRVWCGLRIIFGDGEVREMRVEQVPVVVTKAFAQPGTYAMNIEGAFVGRGLKSALACSGSATSGQLTVFDPVEEERKAQAGRAAKEADDAKVRAAEEQVKALQARTAELERKHKLQLEQQANQKQPVKVPPVEPKRPPTSTKIPPKPQSPAASKPRDKVPVF